MVYIIIKFLSMKETMVGKENDVEHTLLNCTPANSDELHSELQRNTVKPPNKGHIGDRPVVPCREVVLFSEVFF